MNNQTVKKNHHYVWSYYLKRWSKNNRDIYYLTATGKVALDSTKGLAREKKFYKSGQIKRTDISILEELTEQCDEGLKNLHRNFFAQMWFLQELTREIKDKDHRTKMEEQINSNTFEDYLSTIEFEGKYYIDKIISGEEIDFTVKKNVYELTYFLGYQFARTKKINEIIKSSIDQPIGTPMQRKMWKDFSNRNWWFMCSFFATNVAKSMALNNELRINILNNNSEEMFITSDQPVININRDEERSKYFDLYYPLSPTKALMVCTSPSEYSKPWGVDKEQVDWLNRSLSKQAHTTIYGESKKDIDRYKKYVKKAY